jgi:hypothetical protein
MLKRLTRMKMPHRQHTLDRQPGSAPDIRADVRGVTFVMRPAGIRRNERLVIHCDEDGEIRVAIEPESKP